ncbi:MAG TPA: orotidine-5'-phosphate decarboxylase [Chthoniobacterales bacterium]
MRDVPKRAITAAEKIIVALDVATAEEALDLVRRLQSQVSRFKIGLQLYTAAGPEVVRQVVRTGAKIFLDLKLHDIPNTVGSAVKTALDLGIDMLTIHLSGGDAMIRAAVDAAGEKVTLLGVTVLTSQTSETLRSIGVNEAVENHVLRLATLGIQCGVGGLVASAREVAALRRDVPKNIRLVTPGIRPEWAEAGDQRRVTTPLEAIEAGADYLVIGRPITGAPDPSAAFQRLLAEFENR